METLSATARVFKITELLEAILLNLESSDPRIEPHNDAHPFHVIQYHFGAILTCTKNNAPPPALQLFVLQRVNRDFQATIVGSKALQRNLTVSSSIEMYASHYRVRSHTIMLANFIDVMDRKIRSAWAASIDSPPNRSGGESWKSMKINDPDSRDCVKIATFLRKKLRFNGSKNKKRNKAELQTKPDTTLGEFLDWKLGIKARTRKEQCEIVAALRMESQK